MSSSPFQIAVWRSGDPRRHNADPWSARPGSRGKNNMPGGPKKTSLSPSPSIRAQQAADQPEAKQPNHRDGKRTKQQPARAIWGIVIRPVPNTMALGGVATASMKAQDASSAVTAARAAGF